MTLTRYDEIMDRVEVTPEMRERVLANATEAAAKPVTRRNPWKSYALVAACLALVLLGSLTLPKLLSGSETETEPTDQGVQVGWDMVEYSSAEALSRAAGFPVPEPRLDTWEAHYQLIGGELAQIWYATQRGACCYRISAGSEDNSGDYNEYETVRAAALGSVEVTLKGDETNCYLALWTADGYSYSLSCDYGVSYDTMETYLAYALEP